jgi:hypothetical protein
MTNAIIIHSIPRKQKKIIMRKGQRIEDEQRRRRDNGSGILLY